jgi:hypothetical protein
MVLLKSGKPYSNIIRRKDNKLFCHTFTAVSPREKWVSFAVSEDDMATQLWLAQQPVYLA